MNDKQTAVRRALGIAAKAYAAFRRAAVPGATEKELEAAVLAAAGNCETRYDLITGPRTADIEGGAIDRVLLPGDTLLLDLCVLTDGYWCDVCRTYFLGKPTEDAAQTYQKTLACANRVAELLVPGAAAASLFHAAEAFFAANGLNGCLKHHTGHGIGKTPFEAPVETPGSQDILHEGDVVTVEIGAYREGRYGIRIEDDYLLTAGGALRLWDEPNTLDSAILPLGSEKG